MQINLNQVDVFSILSLADYYQISSLKADCERFILSKLTHDNVSYCLQMASRYMLEDIAQKCMDVISKDAREVRFCCSLSLQTTVKGAS